MAAVEGRLQVVLSGRLDLAVPEGMNACLQAAPFCLGQLKLSLYCLEQKGQSKVL